MTLAAVDYPTVVLHQVLDVSRNVDAAFLVAWSTGGGARVEVVCRNGVADVRSGTPAGVPGPAEMSLGLVDALSDREAGAAGDDGAGADAEDAAWRRLCAHAERRLVEGTERSRLAGAGAGVVDTD